MPRLTDVQRTAFGYWYQLITDAANAGFTVTDTVQLASQVATDLGSKLSFEENTAISVLYGYVRREINAGNVFRSASPDQYITAGMMSVPAYARDEAEQATYPLYHVRFEYTYLDKGGNQRTEYKTSAIPDVLPGTVGELTSDVLDDAEAMARKYDHTLLSVKPLNILVV